MDSQGKQRLLKTTKGWQLCICWKDGSTSWEKLADLKEGCYPVQVAKWTTATASQLAWWSYLQLVGIEYTKFWRNVTISFLLFRSIRLCTQRRPTCKFSAKLLKSVAHAYELDKKITCATSKTRWATLVLPYAQLVPDVVWSQEVNI